MKEITYTCALELIATVFTEATERRVRLASAVVDRGGNFVATARMDNAQLGALSLAGDKAFTAASFGYSTSAWAQSSAPGGGDWGLAQTINGRIVVFPGGVPLYSDGELIGAIGVSGTVSLVDEQCAVLAAEALGFRVRA